MHLFKVAVEVVVRDQGRLLLNLRPSTDEDHPGTLCFPGGKVEQHETVDAVLEHVAVREVQEETGLQVQNLRYVYSSSTLHGHQPTLFVTFLAEKASGTLQKQQEEVADLLWLTPAEVLADGRTPSWIAETVRRCGLS